MSDLVVILTTTATAAEANALAAALVDEKLAACVLIQPGTSSYCFWDGKAQLAEEVTVLIKTTADMTAAVEERFKTLHPYKVPVFIVMPSTYASASYSDWVREALGK